MDDQRDMISRDLSPKILISTQNVAIGGGVVALVDFLGPYLRKAGYDVTYVFPSRSIREMVGPGMVQHGEVKGIQAIQMRSIPYILLLDQVMAAFSIQKILSHYDVYQVVGGANLPGIPFMMGRKPYLCWVATTIKDEDKLMFRPLHPSEFSMRTLLYYLNYLLTPLARWYEKRIYQKAAKILTISQYTASSIQQEYGILVDKFHVIPFPIDVNRFKPIMDVRIMASDFILMVGRITDPRKNIKLLLKSFAHIGRCFADLKLVVIGRKPKNDKLVKFCRKLGIEDSVMFLGHVSEQELIRYYSQAQLSVLPSLQEGLGIVVLESMACGTPVVSTKCGGPEEIITHEENGYLVENNDTYALADGVIKLLSNDTLRGEMGKKAREHICQYYSLEQIETKLMEAYKEVYPRLFNGAD